MTAAATGAAVAAAAGAAVLREREAEQDEGTSAEVWGRDTEPDGDTAPWERDERGMTYRELLMTVAAELRFADPADLDRPVRVDLGDSIDGLQSILYDGDARRLVLHPWLTRRVPRTSLPEPGLHDFLIRRPEDVGAALRVIRARRDMKRAAVQTLAGVALSAVSRIEGGKFYPSLDMLVRIAAALRTGVEIRDEVRDRGERPDFVVTDVGQVGPVLRALRTRRGTDIAPLAQSIETPQKMLRQYETGATHPSLTTVVKLLGALDAVLVLSDLDRREQRP